MKITNRRTWIKGSLAFSALMAFAQGASAEVKELTKAGAVRALLNISDRCAKQGATDVKNIGAWKQISYIILDCAQKVLAIKFQ